MDNNPSNFFSANYNSKSNFINSSVLNSKDFSLVDLSDNIDVLNLPPKIQGILRRNKIRTVCELLGYSENDLRGIPNLGPKSVSFLVEVEKKLKKLYSPNQFLAIEKEIEALKWEKIEGKCCSVVPLEKLIDEFLSVLADRERIILMERFGLLDGEHKTLESIGFHYGLTRERIRQIQNKGLLKLKRSMKRNSALRLVSIVSSIISKHFYIISGEEADQFLNYTFKETVYDGSSILDLLAELGMVSNINIGDIELYSDSKKCSLSEVSESIFKTIKSHKEVLYINKLKAILNDLNLIRFDLDKFHDFIKRYIRFDPRIILLENQVITLNSPQRKTLWLELIRKVLDKARAPLHYTEIADRLNSLLLESKLYVDPRRVHALLIEESEFAHSGRWGMYGLAIWGFRKESTTDLISEYMKTAGHPLHVDQILAYVGKFKDTSKGNIRSVLETNKRFIRVSSNMFYFKD